MGLITKEDIISTISKMNVLEILELSTMIEKVFNVKPFENLNVNKEKNNDSIDTNETIVLKEKEVFTIMLVEQGTNKIAVIKAIRAVTGLGLKEAKQLVESAPIKVKENVGKKEAEEIKNNLEIVGAKVELQ